MATVQSLARGDESTEGGVGRGSDCQPRVAHGGAARQVRQCSVSRYGQCRTVTALLMPQDKGHETRPDCMNFLMKRSGWAETNGECHRAKGN